jgi:carbon-monoxide dehydrogenase large subunit
VDIHTGKVEVQKYYVVHDCGNEINPQIVEGQLYGGVMQGLGGALFEEIAYDDQGQLISETFKDYLLPNVFTVPEIKLIKVEHFSTRNTLGIKGAGEGGAICPPAAVANAVANALEPFGVQIHEIPVKPELVKSLLRESKQLRSS